MSNVRFISDLHFGHKWMANNRGFKDEFHHNEYIINKWNSIVHKKDLTYVLGDITMGNTLWYPQLDKLKGRIIIIMGNHDDYRHVPELLKHVERVSGPMVYKGFMLTHIPIHPHELYDNYYDSNWRGNIHGHMHDDRINDPMYYHVSAEEIDYTPRTLNELMERNKVIFKDGKLIENYKEIQW